MPYVPSVNLSTRFVSYHGWFLSRFSNNRLDLTKKNLPKLGSKIQVDQVQIAIEERIQEGLGTIIRHAIALDPSPRHKPITINGIFIREVANMIRERLFLKDDKKSTQLLKDLAEEWIEHVRKNLDSGWMNLVVNSDCDLEIVIDQAMINHVTKPSLEPLPPLDKK